MDKSGFYGKCGFLLASIGFYGKYGSLWASMGICEQVWVFMAKVSHSTLSVAFRKTINLGDAFWISEIRFQYHGPISRDNKVIDYIFSKCHVYVFLSTCYEF